MNHVAIDLGGRKSQVCVRDERGEIVEERVEQEPSVVILETCSEAFHVADLARAAGHEPIVVAATLVRSLGVGARRVKTDRRDAQILSEVSSRVDLSSVHIPSPEARREKTVCSMREGIGWWPFLVHQIWAGDGHKSGSRRPASATCGVPSSSYSLTLGSPRRNRGLSRRALLP